MDPGTSTVASGFSSWAIVLRSSRDAPFTLCAVSEDSPGKRGALWGRGLEAQTSPSCVPTDALILLGNGVPCAIHRPAWSPSGGSVEGARVQQVWINPGQRDFSKTNRRKGNLVKRVCSSDWRQT